jgi:hypothetical protein
MAVGDEVFSGSIPEVYDTYLVPLIFEEFARDLAQRTLPSRPTPSWKRRPALVSSPAL